MSSASPINSYVIAPSIDLRRLSHWIDRAVIGALFLAFAMPFAQVLLLPLGFITLSAYELVFAVVSCLLLMKIILLPKIQHGVFSLWFFGLLALYISASAALAPVEIGDALRQVRFYWPFIIAVLLLMTGTGTELRKYFRYTAISVLVSAMSALLLHYLFPSFVERAFASSPDAAQVMEAGRMLWDGASATLILLLYLGVSDEHSRISKLLLGISLLLAIAATFNTLNRTLTVGIILFLIASVSLARNGREAVRRSMRMIAIVLVIGMVAGALILADDRVRELAFKRYFGDGGGAGQIYEIDLILGRLAIYQQYWQSIVSHFPWGQGFGRPFFSEWGRDVPTSDISIVSFLLPMGIFGVGTFFAFITKLWRTAKINAARLPSSYQRSIRLLIVISLLMSLNIDLYSRNIFVILLTLLIISLKNEHGYIHIAGLTRAHDAQQQG